MALPVGGGGLGLVVLLLAVLFGGNIFGGGTGVDVGPRLDPFPQAPEPGPGEGLANAPDPDAQLVEFVEFVVADVQDAWERQFAEAGRDYQETQLVIFEDQVSTSCGQATSAVGPFYCPADGLVYLDLGFFRELATRFGAPGDFAQAYVIAHEFGHHVQNILGISDEVGQAQQADPEGANELSIRLELQADCFAGIWGHSTYEDQQLEEGDLEEGLAAAAAVGDDRIQAQTSGSIRPETWTHGSSEQRVEWFRRGFDTGDPNTCDTFS
jgi:predicted metalloprotease